MNIQDAVPDPAEGEVPQQKKRKGKKKKKRDQGGVSEQAPEDGSTLAPTQTKNQYPGEDDVQAN